MNKILSILLWLRSYLIVRPIKGCLGKAIGCLLLVVLFVSLLLGLLWFGVRKAGAQGAEEQPLAVYLLVDNSNSMWELGGVGSDPQLLRIDAARLFISYLGVDESRLAHQCAVIFFGSEAQVAAPLMALTGERRREEMLGLIEQPQRMGWTDQAAALALARGDVATVGGDVRPAVVLLTDGRPDWDYDPTAQEREAYRARLQDEGAALAEAGVPLFIILLANESTDNDPDIAQIWQPLWREMAEMTAPGRFYVAREAVDLTDIYHDIVVALTGNRTAGPVLQAEVGAGDLRRTITIEDDIARLTLVISKEHSDLAVSVMLPDGTLLGGSSPGVRYAGQPGVTREEIWVVDEPAAGDWTVLVSGEGRLTVWKDYRPAPTPVPTAVPTVEPTPTLAPTATPIPTATETVAPTPPPTMTATRAPLAPAPASMRTIGTAAPQQGRGSVAAWGVMALVTVATGALVGYRRRYGQRPVVQGELVHVSGPAFADGVAAVELDVLARGKVTVGAPPADIVVDEMIERFVLAAGNALEDGYETLILGGAAVLVNDAPLSERAQRLQDMDTISFGASVLCYENLRLRSAMRARL